MDFNIDFQLIYTNHGKIKGFYLQSDGSDISYLFCKEFIGAWCQNNAQIIIDDNYITFNFPAIGEKLFQFYMQSGDLKDIQELIAPENQDKVSIFFHKDKEGNGIVTISWKNTEI